MTGVGVYLPVGKLLDLATTTAALQKSLDVDMKVAATALQQQLSAEPDSLTTAVTLVEAELQSAAKFKAAKVCAEQPLLPEQQILQRLTEFKRISMISQ